MSEFKTCDDISPEKGTQAEGSKPPVLSSCWFGGTALCSPHSVNPRKESSVFSEGWGAGREGKKPFTASPSVSTVKEDVLRKQNLGEGAGRTWRRTFPLSNRTGDQWGQVNVDVCGSSSSEGFQFPRFCKYLLFLIYGKESDVSLLCLLHSWMNSRGTLVCQQSWRECLSKTCHRAMWMSAGRYYPRSQGQADFFGTDLSGTPFWKVLVLLVSSQGFYNSSCGFDPSLWDCVASFKNLLRSPSLACL